MKWLVAAVVALAVMTGVSTAVALEARDSARAAPAAATTGNPAQSLAEQVTALQRAVAHDRRAVDGSNDLPERLTPLQQDVRDLGISLQMLGGRVDQVEQAVNELLAICRGEHIPGCPDDL